MSTTALAVTLPTVKITVTTASGDTTGAVKGIGRNDYAQGTVQVICDTDPCMSVFDNTNEIEPQGPFEMEIRGRGHSTWGEQAKKPFQLKLEDKETFLGMPKDKKWILLNGHSDPSLVRNPLAFELGRQSSSLEFTPKGEFVRVEINNEYQGVYYITQKVEDTGRRVDLDDKGYLLEWDTIHDDTHRPTSSEQYCTDVNYVWADEYCKFKDWDDDSTTEDTCECETGDETTVACTEYQQNVKNDMNPCVVQAPTFFATDLTGTNEYLNIKEPDLEKTIAKNAENDEDEEAVLVSAAIVTRIERFIKDFESKLTGEVQSWAAVEDMINVDSFVDWYLINEIAKNVDARYYSSIYSNIKFSSDLDDDAVEFNACQESPNQCQINCAGGNDDKACQAMLKRCECASGKLAMGPLWDFDLGFGIGNGPTSENIVYEGFWVNDHRWISRLLLFPEFKDKVEARFSQYYNEKQETLDKIEAWGVALADGATANAEKWPEVFDEVANIWPNSPNMQYSSHNDAIAGLKAWYSNRLQWIYDNINEL
jgi:hypothetical protein